MLKRRITCPSHNTKPALAAGVSELTAFHRPDGGNGGRWWWRGGRGVTGALTISADRTRWPKLRVHVVSPALLSAPDTCRIMRVFESPSVVKIEENLKGYI